MKTQKENSNIRLDDWIKEQTIMYNNNTIKVRN